MSRKAKTLINEYESLYAGNEEAFAFYPKELRELENISKSNTDLLINALKYGFMCGYKAQGTR